MEGRKAFSYKAMPFATAFAIIGFVISYLYQRAKNQNNEIVCAKERLNYLLTAGPAVIYTCRASGDYDATFISNNIYEQTGYEPRQFTEESDFWLRNIHPADKDHVINGLPELFRLGYLVHKYRFQCNTGEYIWMRDELKLIKDTSGEPIEIVGYWTDISELMHSQEELIKAKEGLEQQVEIRTSELTNTNQELNKEIYSRIKIQEELNNAIDELKKALAEIKTLKAILPICTNCKKIRDDRGYWQQVELYISENTNTLFSHGICPDCMEELYPEYVSRMRGKDSDVES
jgi:ribosomal protein L29